MSSSPGTGAAWPERLPRMTAAQAAMAGQGLARPLRWALHRLLLRGLRAPRLSHPAGWHHGAFGGQRLRRALARHAGRRLRFLAGPLALAAR